VHPAERYKQFNNEDITPEQFKEKLMERLMTADIKQVKEDVLPFVRYPKDLDIWSNDYFVQLADMVRIEKTCINLCARSYTWGSDILGLAGYFNVYLHFG
jgi:hypothetical protein